MARAKKLIPSPPPQSVRSGYVDLGVDGYYRTHAADYRNPHEPEIGNCLAVFVQRRMPDLSYVLDLACGSGEATLALRALGAERLDGMDPFTGIAYAARTGQPAEAISFEMIAGGALTGRRWSLIVCSFALHLLPASRLAGTLTQLALCAPELWVITPHKRPDVRPAWGWRLIDEIVVDRVRGRAYQS
ncbi:MAG TPA: class I SAM-dependent methyltransferase [Thermoflexales bacterium]|nr:class I SAM-dependent methyltransferase [Thermoflexales bacterium]HQZ52651.1 class I SAM-dependent methyltransferase [Thermoflexales bacterium]